MTTKIPKMRDAIPLVVKKEIVVLLKSSSEMIRCGKGVESQNT